MNDVLKIMDILAAVDERAIDFISKNEVKIGQVIDEKAAIITNEGRVVMLVPGCNDKSPVEVAQSIISSVNHAYGELPAG